MIASTGYGTNSAQEPLSKLNFQRRDPRPDDVQINILYCGVCHSDLHTARNSSMTRERSLRAPEPFCAARCCADPARAPRVQQTIYQSRWVRTSLS